MTLRADTRRTDSTHPSPKDSTTRWLRIGIPVLLVLIWLVGGSIGGPYFGKIDEVSTNDQSTFLPSSAEATQVQQRLADFTGGDTIPAVVVVTGDGALTNDQLASIADLATTISGVEGVGEVSPGIPSDDGEAVQLFVPIETAGDVGDTVEAVRAAVAADLPSGMDAWVTGPAGFTADLVGECLQLLCRQVLSRDVDKVPLAGMPVLPPPHFRWGIGEPFQLGEGFRQLRGVVLGIDDRITPTVADDEARGELVVTKTSSSLPIEASCNAALVFSVYYLF